MVYFAIRDKQTGSWVVSTIGDGVAMSRAYGAFTQYNSRFETSLHNLLTATFVEGEKFIDSFEVVELREVKPSKPCDFCQIVKENLADLESVLLGEHPGEASGIVSLCPHCGRSIDLEDEEE